MVLLWILGALAFMALPAINLVNINLSRIYERASEIGVRKAFGAASRDLVLQFVIENVVLSLIGGVIGLIGAFAVLQVVALFPQVPFLDIRLNWRIFTAALALAIVFGLLSGRLAGLEDVAPASGPGAARRCVMIRHVFKLVWNRKRSTGLILVEILICFLVLCGILAAGVNLAYEWSSPLGFDYENVWAVEISGMDYGGRGRRAGGRPPGCSPI